MTKQQQGGFTLIELMIVVAIIGILAAVALPQYQDYVAKSQAAEAVALAGSAKTAIAEYHQINGSYPTASTTPNVGNLAATGSYAALTATASTGVLVVTMNSSGVSTAIQGAVFTFTPDITDNTFKWTCTSDLGDDTRLAPQNCKGATATTGP